MTAIAFDDPILLVQYIDQGGAPRAYAYGPISQADEVRDLAARELEEYLATAIAPAGPFRIIEQRSDQGRGLLHSN